MPLVTVCFDWFSFDCSLNCVRVLLRGRLVDCRLTCDSGAILPCLRDCELRVRPGSNEETVGALIVAVTHGFLCLQALLLGEAQGELGVGLAVGTELPC